MQSEEEGDVKRRGEKSSESERVHDERSGGKKGGNGKKASIKQSFASCIETNRGKDEKRESFDGDK